jgi:hypothetical protein
MSIRDLAETKFRSAITENFGMNHVTVRGSFCPCNRLGSRYAILGGECWDSREQPLHPHVCE